MDVHGALAISQADRRPMYVQIVEQVKQRVAVGDWGPGFEMPSIRELAVALQVSVITVKRAYLELERDGVLVTRQGKGSWVAEGSGLGRGLIEAELDGHLDRAVAAGQQLGLAPAELTARLHERLRRRQED
jgi:GntR family transcriptional regulator